VEFRSTGHVDDGTCPKSPWRQGVQGWRAADRR
jgi:hypothetical protein